ESIRRATTCHSKDCSVAFPLCEHFRSGSLTGTLQQAVELEFSRRLLHVEHRVPDHLPNCRPVFEAVSRASTHNPDILRLGMTVQNKILICRVLVLTHAAFNQRRIGQSRKAKPYISACRRQALSRNLAFHSRGINDRAARIVGNLEPSPMISRDAVIPMLSRKALKGTFAVITPHR